MRTRHNPVAPSRRLPCLPRRASLALAACAVSLTVPAFPPAPHHILFGTVRDALGNPLDAPNAQVLLEIDGAASSVRSPVVQGSLSGVNYRIHVPIDSGATSDAYQPSALRPALPFRLRVVIGNAVYLPIEMIGASKITAQPSASTRLDLTLGVDSDGDGLPDAWEQALIAALGGNRSLGDIRPGDDSDGDGLSNLNEYIAGTYAFDPADGFALTIVSTSAGRSTLAFTALRGRTYAIQASSDTIHWSPIPFTLASDAPGAAPRVNYTSTDVRPLQAVVGPFTDATQPQRFFRLTVQ